MAVGQGPIFEGFNLGIQPLHHIGHKGLGNRLATQFMHDFGDFACRDPIDYHFHHRKQEGLFVALVTFKELGFELARARAWDL